MRLDSKQYVLRKYRVPSPRGDSLLAGAVVPDTPIGNAFAKYLGDRGHKVRTANKKRFG